MIKIYRQQGEEETKGREAKGRMRKGEKEG